MKMEIRVYSYENGKFETKHVTEKSPEVKYTDHAYAVSAFEFKYPLDEYGVKEFVINRIVLIEKSFIGLIYGISVTANADQRMLTVSGHDIKRLFTNRPILPINYSGVSGTAGYEATKGYTEDCIKHYWKYNVGELADTYRRVPFFVTAPSKSRGNPNDKYMARFGTVADVTSELARTEKLAVTTAFDLANSKVIFDVKVPAMLPMVLSLDRATALSVGYEADNAEYRNAFYATRSGAQFADEAYTALYYRDDKLVSGHERVEQHLNVSVSTPETGREYEEMKRQAVHGMKDYEQTEQLTATVNFTKEVYRRDYNVGDFLTVQLPELNLTSVVQITAVEVSESGNSGRVVNAVLGDERKQIIQKIRAEIKNS